MPAPVSDTGSRRSWRWRWRAPARARSPQLPNGLTMRRRKRWEGSESRASGRRSRRSAAPSPASTHRVRAGDQSVDVAADQYDRRPTSDRCRRKDMRGAKDAAGRLTHLLARRPGSGQRRGPRASRGRRGNQRDPADRRPARLFRSHRCGGHRRRLACQRIITDYIVGRAPRVHREEQSTRSPRSAEVVAMEQNSVLILDFRARSRKARATHDQVSSASPVMTRYATTAATRTDRSTLPEALNSYLRHDRYDRFRSGTLAPVTTHPQTRRHPGGSGASVRSCRSRSQPWRIHR